MDLNIFNGFQIFAMNTLIEAQMIPSLASGKQV